jgi:hypothetical protein
MRQFCFTDSYLLPAGGCLRYRVSREYRLVSAPDHQIDGLLLCFGAAAYPIYGDWIVEAVPSGEAGFLVTSAHTKAADALFWAFRSAGMTSGDAQLAASHVKWVHQDQLAEPVTWEEEAPRCPGRSRQVLLGTLFFLLALAGLITILCFSF